MLARRSRMAHWHALVSGRALPPSPSPLPVNTAYMAYERNEKAHSAKKRPQRPKTEPRDPAARKLRALMRQDALIWKQNHPALNSEWSGSDPSYVIWDSSGVADPPFSTARATCTPGELMEEFEQLLFGNNGVPLFWRRASSYLRRDERR